MTVQKQMQRGGRDRKGKKKKRDDSQAKQEERGEEEQQESERGKKAKERDLGDRGRKRGSGGLVTVCPRQPENAVQRSGGQSGAAKISTYTTNAHKNTHKQHAQAADILHQSIRSRPALFFCYKHGETKNIYMHRRHQS